MEFVSTGFEVLDELLATRTKVNKEIFSFVFQFKDLEMVCKVLGEFSFQRDKQCFLQLEDNVKFLLFSKRRKKNTRLFSKSDLNLIKWFVLCYHHWRKRGTFLVLGDIAFFLLVLLDSNISNNRRRRRISVIRGNNNRSKSRSVLKRSFL
jgi:hypothetical protein